MTSLECPWCRKRMEDYRQKGVLFVCRTPDCQLRGDHLTRDAIASITASPAVTPSPAFARDREATCDWNCARTFPHEGPCSAVTPSKEEA